MTVKFVIGNKDNSQVWIEEFVFPKGTISEHMIKYVRSVIKKFNRTVKPGEKPRKYIAKLT
jgi:hypothetical protein